MTKILPAGAEAPEGASCSQRNSPSSHHGLGDSHLPAQTRLLTSPQVPGTTLQLTGTRTTTNQEHSRSASWEPSPSPGTESSRTCVCSSLPMLSESPVALPKEKGPGNKEGKRPETASPGSRVVKYPGRGGPGDAPQLACVGTQSTHSRHQANDTSLRAPPSQPHRGGRSGSKDPRHQTSAQQGWHRTPHQAPALRHNQELGNERKGMPGRVRTPKTWEHSTH